jgi:sucrose-6-phosphate hydrolase SacC (GH32 family)
MSLSRLVFCLPVLAISLCAAPAGFLFVTFQQETSAQAEQIYMALSADGRSWTALNDGKPVLVSDVGEKGVRDACLIRAHDGRKFFLIATDLSIYRTKQDWKRAVRAGSRSIVIWESTNLVDWSAPRLARVAADDAGCTWAPEAIYDEENGDYLVFWASTNQRDDFSQHRIWAARTRDFVTFGAPFIFIEKPNTVIDTTIVRDGPAYFRFTKDEKVKSIFMETAPRLSGPWREVTDFSLGQKPGFEGPECYQLEPATADRPAVWCLILDQYSKGAGYQPFVTNHLAAGRFEPGAGFTFPFRFRHGSVLPLTAEEYRRLAQ